MNKEHLLFGSCLFIFILHQVLEKIVHLSPGLADNYLDALVCISLPILHCAGYFIVIAIVAELFFPSISNRFTADFLDILCYASGTLLYIGLNYPSNSRTRTTK